MISQAKKGSSSNDDCIDITSSPPPSTEPSESKASLPPPPPARRTLGANHIPGLAVGVGERGRQEAIKDAQDRKIKSGFTNDPAVAERMYTFVISAAHYCYKPAGWKKSPTNWMHSERDRPVTSTQLLESLLEGVRAKVTRNEYVTWLAPSESGNWSLCLFASCVVEPWTEPMTIKQMLEVRPFKVASDNKKRQQVTVVLAWQPDPPPSSPAPEEASDTTPTIPATAQDRKKKRIKKEVVKKEPIEKRPISAGSAERNTTAKRIPIGQPNVRTRAAIVKQDPEPVKEEPIEQDATEDEDLPDLEEILRNAGKKM
jgi:hypothetical protein